MIIVLLVIVWNVSFASNVVLVFVPTFGKSKRRVPDCVDIVSTLKCALLAGFWSPPKKNCASV